MIQLDDKKYFEYNMIGEFTSDTKWIHPDITVPTYELIFVIEGEVHICEDGNNYSLYRNELILLEPLKRHYGFKNSNANTSFYWFHFYTNMDIPCKVYKNDRFYDIKYLMKRLLHISNTPTYTKYSLDSAGLMVFEELCAISKAEILSSNALINKISEYIRINIKNNVTVSQISDYFGYNPDYIGKLFKKYFNVGLKNYIASEQIKRAKDMLITTNFTVKQISAELGFSSENNFIKFFLYHEDISPTKFRNTYSNTHMNNS